MDLVQYLKIQNGIAILIAISITINQCITGKKIKHLPIKESGGRPEIQELNRKFAISIAGGLSSPLSSCLANSNSK